MLFELAVALLVLLCTAVWWRMSKQGTTAPAPSVPAATVAASAPLVKPPTAVRILYATTTGKSEGPEGCAAAVNVTFHPAVRVCAALAQALAKALAATGVIDPALAKLPAYDQVRLPRLLSLAPVHMICMCMYACARAGGPGEGGVRRCDHAHLD